MRTAVVVFARDLRVHAHPSLAAACAEADRVVPLFVFDDAVLARPIANPNKLSFLLDSVRDLSSSLRDAGGLLVKRRGDWVAEVGTVVADVDADAVFCSADVSAYAQQRLARLREAIAPVEVRALLGVTVVPPGALTTTTGGPYKVFTPYWRRWREVPVEPPPPRPTAVPVPSRVKAGATPSLADLTGRSVSPDLPQGGESQGRALLARWLDGSVDDYHEEGDALAADATSRLSPHLHLGCVAPAEVASRLGEGVGATAFRRQLCWRDFFHELLDATPAASWQDWRTQGDRWAEDDEALGAWKEGRTGYPIVDAGMRQLAREGWLHNRARLVVASFLTHDLYLDWRHGARHFLDLLVDGDVANNQFGWQWVAGTGPTSRTNRVLSPLRQAERFDPDGTYVRRYVPELAGIEGPAVHRPWDLPTDVRAGLDYPEPIVDHDQAVQRFLEARGKA